MLSTKRENAIALRKDAYLEQKRVILQAPEVINNLTGNEMMIASASVEVPIRAIEQKVLIAKVAQAAKFICRDVGISTWNDSEVMQYDAVRLLQLLQHYYSDLSLKEVKLSFEMALIGELDEYLPKNRNGEPDKSHYASFSLEYITKILNAYKAKRGRVWNKARKALPAPEMVITQEQRQSNRREFIDSIYKAFDDYKNKGVEPAFILSIYIKEFIAQGLIEGIEKPKTRAIDKAHNLSILDSSLDKKTKREISEQYHARRPGEILLSKAQPIQNNETIKVYFDSLIDENKELKNLLKYEQ